MGRSFRLGSYLLWGHFTGGTGRLALQLAQAALQFAECGVKGGGTGRQGARVPWQCQSWVAHERSPPEKPGSANPGWRGPLPRQETLAVPELSGSCQINLAVPMLSGAWALPARKTCQCQRSVAPHLANSRFSPHPSSAAPPAPPSQRCSSRRTSSLRLTSNSRARSSRWAT